MDDKKESDRRARVFISCGQSRRFDEVETARNIATRLQELGFAPYIAIDEQTLRGLKENILAQLEKSEYFVFVDFRREQILGAHPPIYRGSLFSHQELAVAAYLDIPVLAFQEIGVKSDDGILRFLQTNAIPFAQTDRHLLPNVVADQVQRQGWNFRSLRELVLERNDAAEHSDSTVRTQIGVEPRRYYYVQVRNLHHHKAATNCYVYLEKAIRHEEPHTELPFNSVELKWSGYTLPNAHVLPSDLPDILYQ
jgi:hypothetical protein